MKRLLITTIAIALAAAMNATAQSTIVNVRIVNGTDASPSASHLWTDTGLSVTNGEVITVNANGNWTYGASTTNGPDGKDGGTSGALFLSNNIIGGLVAYIGSDPFQGQWRTSFFPQAVGYQQIGSSCQFIAATNGELWLGFNDDAVSGTTATDNDGVVKAEILLGYGTASDLGCVDPYITNGVLFGSLPSTKFSFNIVGATNAVLAIYASSDLINWTFLDKVILNDSGKSSAPFTNVTSVPYRFYKAVNGICSSQPYGFVRIPLAAGQAKYIADQLLAPDNTLNGLAPTMGDGSTLPAGTGIGKYDGSAWTFYSWNGSSWSPNGNATLLPGEGAFVTNANAMTISFIGKVPPAPQVNSISAGQHIYSSMVPMGGKITSQLNFPPTPNDTVDIFRGGFTAYGFDPDDLVWSPSEPIVNVGESFVLSTTTNKTWTQDFLFHFSQ